MILSNFLSVLAKFLPFLWIFSTSCTNPSRGWVRSILENSFLQTRRSEFRDPYTNPVAPYMVPTMKTHNLCLSHIPLTSCAGLIPFSPRRGCPSSRFSSNHFNPQIIIIKAFENHSLTINSCLRRPPDPRTPICEIVNANMNIRLPLNLDTPLTIYGQSLLILVWRSWASAWIRMCG